MQQVMKATVELTNMVLGALLMLHLVLSFLLWEELLPEELKRRFLVTTCKQSTMNLLQQLKRGETKTFNDEKWEPTTWPTHAEGFGYMEAPRGALGHWIVIDQGKTENYQMVVPTTWNGSPRDHNDQAGAYEASLVGTPLAKPEWPLEVLRTIHSFDPCMACAIHMIDAEGNDLGETGVGLNVCLIYVFLTNPPTSF